jgi:hypothetical protein
MIRRLDYRKFMAASLLCTALMAFPADASASGPVKLAIFDFEFEDMSAGASATGSAAPSDEAHLANVTSSVRELFEQSGRYSLVDVGSTDVAAAKAGTLRTCNGCDAAIAQQLGADQSFVGVVKRITRTEYTVRFQIRDAQTGAILSKEDSGLRMGADYSWSRGAVRLIKDRLLEKPGAE